MKRLLIIGAGGLGREVYQWACDIQDYSKNWDFIGFIDDNTNALDDYDMSDKIVSNIGDFIPNENDVLVCAIADPKIKLSICMDLLEKKAKFTNLVHPTALIGKDTSIGEGVIVSPKSVVSVNARVGSFVTINCFCIVGHDTDIEDGCTITGNCNVMGNAVLEKGTFLGGGAVILPQIKIGRYAKVGAGSVVIKDVMDNTSVFGNPARKIY